MVENPNREVEEISDGYFQTLIYHLASRITPGKYNSIYGIKRGGMVVAVYLSHLLDIPIVDDKGINPKTLIVDDICDSGETLTIFTKGCFTFKSFVPDTATLYLRKGRSKFTPTYWINDALEYWIKFPWEIK